MYKTFHPSGDGITIFNEGFFNDVIWAQYDKQLISHVYSNDVTVLGSPFGEEFVHVTSADDEGQAAEDGQGGWARGEVGGEV